MTPLQFVSLALLFIGVFGASFALLRRSGNTVVRARIDALADTTSSADGARAAQPLAERIARLATPLAGLSQPEEEADASAIRTRFMNAGFRHASAPGIFFAAKTMLALVLPLLLFLSLNTGGTRGGPATLAWLLLAAAFGNYMPNIVLKQLITRRQREIFENFPDALDLMTICVEAGLAIDTALARVAREIALSSPVLSEEMTLVTLELRAGASKEKALRNLAMRTGVEDVDSLVAMLIQAERFGTSISSSLRVQSDMLRSKRRMRAEEAAAKIGLKLLFPLIFFIFPALLVVLMGPAIIQIYRVLLPSMAGQ